MPTAANDNQPISQSDGSLAIASVGDAKFALINFVRALAVKQARLDAANDNGVRTLH